jgi:hypothetical protein
MTPAKPRFRTIDEYLSYDDGTNTRYELVDEELIEIGAESPLNMAIAGLKKSNRGAQNELYSNTLGST